MLYTSIKHLHILLAFTSLLGFIIRSYWKFTDNAYLNTRLVKICPHIIDSFLLLSGITLLAIVHFSFAAQAWFVVKMICLVLYIGFGVLTLKARQKTHASVGFILALVSFACMIFLAMIKPF